MLTWRKESGKRENQKMCAVNCSGVLKPKQAVCYCQALLLESKVALPSAHIRAGNAADGFTKYKCYVCKQVHVSVSCME